MDTRPNLTKDIAVQDFKDFYWLKKELTDFCGVVGLSKQGDKLTLTNRIETFLETGKIEKSNHRKSKKAQSNFDWNTATLTLKTPLTDNYKNTENVRAFFEKEIGKQFKFNVQFMNWMKRNIGKNLGEAIEAWQQIRVEKQSNKKPKDIAPQFEYNRYIRDFLADNPTEKRAAAIEFWKIKKSKRGDNQYRKSDLKLKKI